MLPTPAWHVVLVEKASAVALVIQQMMIPRMLTAAIAVDLKEGTLADLGQGALAVLSRELEAIRLMVEAIRLMVEVVRLMVEAIRLLVEEDAALEAGILTFIKTSIDDCVKIKTICLF